MKSKKEFVDSLLAYAKRKRDHAAVKTRKPRALKSLLPDIEDPELEDIAVEKEKEDELG